MLVELSAMEQRYQAVLVVVQHGSKVAEIAARPGPQRQQLLTARRRAESAWRTTGLDV